MKPSRPDPAALYVLDLLEPEERARFEADLVRDHALSLRVAQWETELETTIRSLPSHLPRSELWTRLEGLLQPGQTTPAPGLLARPLLQNGNEQKPAARFSRATSALPWGAWLRWGLATSIALSLAILAVQSLRNSSSQKIVVVTLLADRSTFATMSLEKNDGDADARFMQLATLAETYWRRAMPGDSREAEGPSGNRAYALFDPSSKQGFIAIENLPPLPVDRHYQLWLVTADNGRLQNAGTLPLSGGTGGLFSFDTSGFSSGIAAQPRFQITAERDRDALKPEGPVILGGL